MAVVYKALVLLSLLFPHCRGLGVVLPDPTCEFEHGYNDDGKQSLVITCEAESFPEAKCDFYCRTYEEQTPMPVNAEVKYIISVAGGVFTTTCSVTLPLQELGEGRHMFNVDVYPNVTGGEDMVNTTDVGTTDYKHPVTQHECPENWLQDFLCGLTTVCNCTVVEQGFPNGTAAWLDMEGNIVANRSLELSYDTESTEQGYTCAGQSALGSELGSSLQIRTECVSP